VGNDGEGPRCCVHESLKITCPNNSGNIGGVRRVRSSMCLSGRSGLCLEGDLRLDYKVGGVGIDGSQGSLIRDICKSL
jgi:hypothetical protein